jgi:hypothetical protein
VESDFIINWIQLPCCGLLPAALTQSCPSLDSSVSLAFALPKISPVPPPLRRWQLLGSVPALHVSWSDVNCVVKFKFCLVISCSTGSAAGPSGTGMASVHLWPDVLSLQHWYVITWVFGYLTFRDISSQKFSYSYHKTQKQA